MSKMVDRNQVSLFSFLCFSVAFVSCQTPVVLWHGMGDSCCNPLSMGSIKKLIEEQVKGVYVKSLEIGSNVAEDTENGRTIAQTCPTPPILNLISVGGQHQGVYGFPHCPGANSTICDEVRKLLNLGAYVSFVQSRLVQAEYWHDPLQEDLYKKSKSYLQKQSIEIKEFCIGQWFGFYKPGQATDLYTLFESDLYTQDKLGLKELNSTGRLFYLMNTLPLYCKVFGFIKNRINLNFDLLKYGNAY
ncbi:hypothetical protein KUTeg_016707 [Tegillarca granosa]|uniref:Palmitoyl-protein thioesterase 1 n=1 Tax=Tegillarca granosa TaxID=220873 RepID=A0ABQ9ERG1_TEGGR|nr:hypothetical protein KUTeg_016707 [Tegillarca granosa]